MDVARTQRVQRDATRDPSAGHPSGRRTLATAMRMMSAWNRPKLTGIELPERLGAAGSGRHHLSVAAEAIAARNFLSPRLASALNCRKTACCARVGRT